MPCNSKKKKKSNLSRNVMDLGIAGITAGISASIVGGAGSTQGAQGIANASRALPASGKIMGAGATLRGLSSLEDIPKKKKRGKKNGFI